MLSGVIQRFLVNYSTFTCTFSVGLNLCVCEHHREVKIFSLRKIFILPLCILCPSGLLSSPVTSDRVSNIGERSNGYIILYCFIYYLDLH